MFAQDLIVFSPQEGGGVGAGSLCGECLGTGHPGGVPRACTSQLGQRFDDLS